MTTRPKAVLFDAGGTLVLQDPAALSGRLGHQIGEQAGFTAHYQTMEAYARRRQAGSTDDWSWWQEQFFRSLGLADPIAAGPLINNGYGLWFWPIPGVRSALDELLAMSVRMAVVSNSDGSVRQSLTDAGFDGVFEFVIDSQEVGVAKPDPAIFTHALERLGLSADVTWYVGDSIYHDIGGGEAAGLARSLLIDPLDIHNDYDDRIPSVTALPDLIRRLG